ncbi:MAG TPA: glycosyltransferase, partial [Ktedonobacterales bacterium]|nr:glycosyltransferase [Ktedonobacterales bacterium]
MAKQALKNPLAAGISAPGLKQQQRLIYSTGKGKRGYLLGVMVALMLLAGVMTLGVASGKLAWVALLLPILLAVGFGLGVTSPRLALAFAIVSVLSEHFQPSLMADGNITLRFDEIIVIAVAAGVMVRHIRAGTGALPRLLRSVPGIIPLLLFLVENMIVTLLGRKNVGYGFSLIAELAAGILFYIAIVLLLSEIKRPRDIIAPLLLSAGFEACFGLGALGLSFLLHDSTIFGVHRDTTSLLVAPYGTFIEPNFFGHYLAAMTIIIVALLLYILTRRRRSVGTALALIVVGGLAIGGVMASLTRTSWIGLALGVVIVFAIWRLGRRRYENTVKPRRSAAQTARVRWITGGAVAAISAAVVFVLAFTREGEALAQRFSHLLDFTSGSGFGRLKVLELVLDDWLNNPLFGLGTGSFTGHLPGVPPSPHTWIYSMGLAMLHDSGSLGVEIFLFFLWGLFSALWRTIRGTPTSSARALAVGLFGAAVFMLIAAQATSSMYLMLLWLFLGLAAGMPILCASASWQRLIMAGPAVTLSALDATLTDPATRVLPALPKGRGAVEPRMTAIPAPSRGKVLHIYDTGTLGGMQRILLATARGLTKYGWASTAIVGDDGPLAHDLRKAGVRAIALPIAGKRRFTLAFFTLFWRILKAQPDVVIVYGAVVGCVAGLAARLAGVRCVVYQSGSPTFYYNWTRFKRLRNAVVERIACGCAAAVWSVSQENRRLYLANNAAPAYKFV